MVVQIKKGVKEGGFSTTSEFIRHLIRGWNTDKLAEELKKESAKKTGWKELKISKQEFKMGKGKLLKSLKDLR